MMMMPHPIEKEDEEDIKVIDLIWFVKFPLFYDFVFDLGFDFDFVMMNEFQLYTSFRCIDPFVSFAPFSVQKPN